MKTSPLPFDSEALRANLATTAQEVVIPDRYLPLLEAVAGLHGVRAALSDTMGEYFHTFRNAEPLVDGFQTTLLRNWPYFERSDDREKLGINWFKKGFGGDVVQNFNGVKALSLKGRMAVWVYHRLGHAIA